MDISKCIVFQQRNRVSTQPTVPVQQQSAKTIILHISLNITWDSGSMNAIDALGWSTR